MKITLNYFEKIIYQILLSQEWKRSPLFMGVLQVKVDAEKYRLQMYYLLFLFMKSNAAAEVITAAATTFVTKPLRLCFHSDFHPLSAKILGICPLTRSLNNPSTAFIRSANMSGSQ